MKRPRLTKPTKKDVLKAIGVWLLIGLAIQVMMEIGRQSQEVYNPLASTAPAAAKKCDDLGFARTVLANMEDDLRDERDEAYFQTDTHIQFVEGYWEGFWYQHKWCTICLANGDIPEEHLRALEREKQALEATPVTEATKKPKRNKRNKQ